MSRKNASGPNSSSADVKAKTRRSAWRPQSPGMESSIALELAAPSPMAAMDQPRSATHQARVPTWRDIDSGARSDANTSVEASSSVAGSHVIILDIA